MMNGDRKEGICRLNVDGNGCDYLRILSDLETKLRNNTNPKEKIELALQGALMFYGADRAYVIEVDDELGIGVNTYECCAPGIAPEIDNLQFMPFEMFPRWLCSLKSDTPIIITDLEQIKTEFLEEYRYLEKRSVNSLLAVPFQKRLNAGFLGVDNPKRNVEDPGFLRLVILCIVVELNEILLQEWRERRYASIKQPTIIQANLFGKLEIISATDVLKDDSFSNLDNVGVVLLEANTGKIRAMVQKDESEANVNLGIGQLGFEPGSIFKILTEAIALNEGLVNVTDTFTCNGNICTNSGKSYAHGTLTVNKAFEVSCNDIFAKLGQLIGYENLLKYTTNLGLYNKVLGLAGENREEAVGVMPKLTDGVSNFAIGQCVTVTPLQIAGAVNAIVNDGIYIKPSLIEAIVDDDNNVIENIQNEENRIFTSTTSKLVKNSMSNVITNGTGTAAKVDGIIQGGKTGTATGEGGATTHGWFAGYFELDNKLYTLVIVAPNINGVDENGTELAGGNTAAPIYREIIKALISE